MSVAGLENERLLVEPLVGGASHVLRGTGLNILGSNFNKECAVVREYSNDSIQFAAVKSCFIITGVPMLYCQKLKTVLQ